MRERIGVIGGGSWGTALAIALTRSRAPHDVSLWVLEKEICDSIRARRVNDVFLPGFEIPAQVAATNDLAEALAGADIVLGVMPSGHAKSTYTKMLPHLSPQTLFVSATKGLDHQNLKRISEVITEVCAPRFAARVAAPVVTNDTLRLVAPVVQKAAASPATTRCRPQISRTSARSSPRARTGTAGVARERARVVRVVAIAREAIGAAVPFRDARAVERDPEVGVGVLGDLPDIVARQRAFLRPRARVAMELAPVESHEAVLGAEPDEALRVLQGRHDGRLRQAVGRREMLQNERRRIGRRGDRREHAQHC